MAAIVGAAFGMVVAYLIGAGRGGTETSQRMLERERTESERAIARLRRVLEEHEQRGREHAEVLQILPDLVRQMFAVTGRRNVGPLALKLMDNLFHPSQAAIFLARPAQRRLALGSSHGLPTTVQPGFELEYGQGRVGHVAENLLAMDDADFKNATALVRRQVEATDVRELHAECAAPIQDDGGALLGVVCMGGVRTRQDQQKRLLKMIADLTAVALTHVTRLRTTEVAANIDGLTGVFNKRYLQERLGNELHRAEAQQMKVSLLILDIDHFKHYNDNNGHLAGD